MKAAKSCRSADSQSCAVAKAKEIRSLIDPAGALVVKKVRSAASGKVASSSSIASARRRRTAA